MNGRLTITDVAEQLGVTPRTIMRWEKAGKIKKSKRDWRGWRFYLREDLEDIRKFYESSYEYLEGGKPIMELAKTAIVAVIMMLSSLALPIIYGQAYAQTAGSQSGAVSESAGTVDIDLNTLPTVGVSPDSVEEAVKYTLGPDDIIEIDVRRHPEFSGQYTITSEGKIEYKFVGDIIVNGLTKVQVQERLAKILSEYVVEPEVNVRIVAYLSKVYYVVGEVGMPGKFYMRGNSIQVREALVQAGLPTVAAAMRRCRLITPTPQGNKFIYVNVYELLYGGQLEQNLEMKPGEVLYVPATVMAKVIRVIAPVTDVATQAAGTAATGAAVGAAAL